MGVYRFKINPLISVKNKDFVKYDQYSYGTSSQKEVSTGYQVERYFMAKKAVAINLFNDNYHYSMRCRPSIVVSNLGYEVTSLPPGGLQISNRPTVKFR